MVSNKDEATGSTGSQASGRRILVSVAEASFQEHTEFSRLKVSQSTTDTQGQKLAETPGPAMSLQHILHETFSVCGVGHGITMNNGDAI